MENSVKNTCNKIDAIAVLSGGTERMYGLEKSYVPNKSSIKRLLHGITLSKKNNNVPIIILGGVTNNSKIPESELLSNMALGLGVKKDKLILETTSRNTLENIIELQKIVGAKKFNNILVVSSAIHTPRILGILNKQKLSYCIEPTDQKAGKKLHFYDLIPSTKNMEKNSELTYEVLALIKYRLARYI